WVAMNPAPDKYPLLYAIESPADLRRMSFGELPALAAELREFLIQSVSTRGGHFAAGLGTVELTIALHYVFNTPHDRLVWDVGHQAYPHKVLTGRRDRLHTVKQPGGLAPFPTRSESEYDTFGVGHSSTSISAALGMAVAAARAGDTRRVVAVIGAGAPLGGAPERHGVARHAVRGDGLQLHRPHGRSRRQGAGAHAAKPARAARAAAAARRHAQGQGLRAGRGGSDQMARSGALRSGERHHLQGKERRTFLLADLRPMAVR